MAALDTIWARDLSDDELKREVERIGKIVERGFGEGSGSPGEWYCERNDELIAEIQTRDGLTTDK